jgi:hypothetical protein
MLDEMTLVKVTNISSGPVIYRIPELNIRREFNKGQPREISVKELRALAYTEGGMVLLEEFLSVENDEFLAELGFKPEPEYSWTQKEVDEVLKNGSLARLQDALEYAPVGIVDLIKDRAVALKLDSMDKRQAILEATGFNVSSAINLLDTGQEEEAPVAPKGRRAAAEEAAEAPTSGRRVSIEVPIVETHYKITE